jgi:predicted TIM-barrel fold metal-dependent hydrolase
MTSRLLQVVDPHIHLWDSTRVDYPWLADAQERYSGDDRLLPRVYDAVAFLGDVGEIDVLMTVGVEANPADTVAEVQWLQAQAEVAKARGHPHGIVAYADLSDSSAPQMLERLAAFPGVRGIRQILNVHADTRYDYVGRHFIREPLWRENLRRLSRHGMSFDLQLYPSQASGALVVLDANPYIPFIVNHAGMFADRDEVGGWREWRQGLRALAARDNTAIKLSGLAMFDYQWTEKSLRPYVLEVIDAFGPKRCMFASNFPIDRMHAGYEQLWRAYSNIVAGASRQERNELFVDNAVRYYKLQLAPRLQ